ncbi:MAG: DnaJ domain-containing protein [Anaerolineae bacterium]|jgi:DnaJ-class molecular chaperone|nr:DnaJ domain-containing protein [Anaerolineae bacterium]MDH7475637.1 DnaJ C-terminal domain-containing protein [Anaerolineae bacterium]
MEYKDYYRILGVDKTADAKTIKQAYRRLARQYHPDVNPGNKAAEERFKEINEAYEVLSDPEKRKKYDQLGADYQRWQHMGGDPRGFDWSQWFASGQPAGGRVRVEYGDLGDLFGDLGGFSDFFQTIFGGMGGRTQTSRTGSRTWAYRGQDYEHSVEITLEEAFQGTQRVLEKEGGRRLTVKIPPGVKTGSKIRIAGEGGPGVGGGPQGDLFLQVKVLPHPTFERDGDDLRCEMPVDLYTALLGGEITVHTLDGDVKLKVPPETQSGQVFRLRGKGMPHLQDPKKRGDLYVKVQVRLPTKLTAKEKALVRELASLRNT